MIKYGLSLLPAAGESLIQRSVQSQADTADVASTQHVESSVRRKRKMLRAFQLEGLKGEVGL